MFKRSILIVVLLALIALASSARLHAAPEKHLVRHFVAFKFKDGTTASQVSDVLDSFKHLKKEIANVLSLENGVNSSPENLNKGLTHAFLLTFPSTAARDVYLNHPSHLKFKDKALPLVADVFVMDFSPEK